jgi:hypothetical protein
LLVGLPEELATATIYRLIAQGDEVRYLAANARAGEFARKLGAFVAVGSPSDFDLTERATQNVRTVVFGEAASGAEEVEGLLFGGKNAGVGRWIYVAPVVDPAITGALRDSGKEFVTFATGRKTLLRGRAPSVEKVAEAIDAADDLAGEPKLELDLRDTESWVALKLEGPE